MYSNTRSKKAVGSDFYNIISPLWFKFRKYYNTPSASSACISSKIPPARCSSRPFAPSSPGLLLSSSPFHALPARSPLARELYTHYWDAYRPSPATQWIAIVGILASYLAAVLPGGLGAGTLSPMLLRFENVSLAILSQVLIMLFEGGAPSANSSSLRVSSNLTKTRIPASLRS